LRSLIRMVDDVRRSALPKRHVQGIEHQLGGEAGRHRPADDPTAEGVEHHRQVKKAGPGRDVGQVGHPQGIRPIGAEVAVDQIRRLAAVISSCRDHAPSAADPGQAS